MSGRLRDLSLRWKLTLTYAAGTSIVLAMLGTAMYFHVKAGLDAGVNDRLAARVDDVDAAAHRDTAAARTTLAAGEEEAQILAADGHVIAGRPGLSRPLLSPGEVRRARSARLVLDRGEQARILARPASAGRVIAASGSLAQRERALEQFSGILLIGFPVGVLLVAGAAYAITGAALRPVAQMRRRAQTISAADSRARLPLPAAQDEIHRLGDTLNEMLDRLHASAEHERGFISDASHELRTPLTVLKAEIDLALRGKRSAAELREALVRAGAETDRLIALAEGLLVLAREDQGLLSVEARTTDAIALVNAVARRFEPSATSTGRRLIVETPPSVTVHGDPAWLEQALGNLVDNALLHGRGAVRLSARKDGDLLELHVRDEGPGFPAEFLPRAFDRFTRADTARAGTGTGLGLAIVSAVARAHRGSAHAANRDPGGDVWLSLPASQPKPSA